MRVVAKGQAERSLIWATLDYTRFNLGVIALGAVFLVGAEQGADVVRGLATGDPVHQALFFLAVFAWGWQSWFWARFMLQDRLTELELALDREKEACANRDPCRAPRAASAGAVRFVRWYPRALGLLAMALATVALVASYGVLDRFVGINLATIALYAALVIFRRRIRRRFSGSAVLSGAQISAGWIAWIAEPLFRLRPAWRGDTDMPTLAPYTILAGVAVMAATSAWALADPVGYGFAVGSAAVVFIGLASILPAGSLAIWATRERGRPVLSAIVAAAVLFSFVNANNQVRAIDGPAAAKPGAWESLDAMLARHGACTEPVPVVAVATAGGGVRAAYWTATVLSGIEDEVRGKLGDGRSFSDHLFAVSGVSGGSVGAAFYVTALRDVGAATSNTETLQQALSADFLGPTLTGLLYHDLWQTFLPWPLLTDRGAILERAFEASWAARWPGGDGLAAGLAAFTGFETPRGGWIPRLLLNGTNTVTGQRMVASTVALRDARGDRPQQVIVDALDQHAYLSDDPDGRRPDMRLSTAAHNSARFPVISPGGLWPRGRSMVVDGGYFENFGAETLLDLLRYLQIRSRSDPLRCPIRPIVVQISSDPEIGNALTGGRIDPAVDRGGPGSRLWNVVGGPAGGILNARSSRGTLAANALRRWPQSLGPDKASMTDPLWVHFRMPPGSEIDRTARCPGAEAIDPPLGWVLSRQSAEAIRGMLACARGNRDAMDRLLEAMLPATVMPDGEPAPATVMN
ncbi:MAG: patatin-like phospholipase family protein [Thalassobaculum sp.]|uniref:patatin-like phospholipase family protein n=1 Tax=Thalassobaculum sp. TaxID=2022740 RepID=UPI0032EC0385